MRRIECTDGSPEILDDRSPASRQMLSPGRPCLCCLVIELQATLTVEDEEKAVYPRSTSSEQGSSIAW